MRTLIGAVGYRNLRDHSAAFEVIERLERLEPEAEVTLEDASYNPVALVQWLESLPADERFAQVVFVAAVARSGRSGGDLTAYRWDGCVPPDDVVQQAVTEAVTGIINLDNTLTIAGYFKALPALVAVVEIEPIDHAFGSEFSTLVSDAISDACALARRLATRPGDIAALPARGLELRPHAQASWS